MAHARSWIRSLLVFALGGIAAAQRTPDEALLALQAGNERFAAERSVPQPVGDGVRRSLARGQNPFAIVLCCADSRVPPEHVFNAGLGELFVVRVAGHTCDPETLASIEYAVEHLNASLCVVMGHEGCGAVAASIEQGDRAGRGHANQDSAVVQQLLEQIEPAVRKARARDLSGKPLRDACEEEHAHHTVHECMRRSELLRRSASVGKFRMVAARYHLESGTVEWLPARPLPAEPQPEPKPAHGVVPGVTPPHTALAMLQAGHRRFLGDGRPAANLTAERREALTHGQQPLAIVLTCADSRVAPEHVFDAGLGELVVIRVAGNTLNDDVLASIEQAAAHTGVSLLVVMGHTKCGAVQAASQEPSCHELTPSLRALLTRLEPAVAEARARGPADVVDLAIRLNVQRTVVQARSRSGLLRQLESEGRFAMLPAYYDITSGDLHWLRDAQTAAAPPAVPGGETMAHGALEPTPAAHEHGAPAGEPPAGTLPHAEPPAVVTGPAPHGTHHASAAAAPMPVPEAGGTSSDPRVLVGTLGAVSLLLAALLVTRRR